MNTWITPEALADANAMLPSLQIAADVMAHGDETRDETRTVFTYCACCDRLRRGILACEECGAPWERA